ncbi:calcium-transporting ATPase 12, plasma membrane-type-like [Coffea eugenioides]|uniref:calcium-transporting ATPase 12, plasma membrane-type-like n=1 Tax=Coffea eugenioides TaxID=49369 RepID=UPI000F609221|nr:calcium-transporting ATPase 12, plasma membrane-type-like [Coffea eugenioides]
MSDTSEASFNAVESPLLPTRAQKRCQVQKRWRVISITVRSIRRFSSVKEEVVVNDGVELTPIVFDAQKRLRAFWTTLYSINAFCRAKDIAPGNQSGLLDNPLPSPFDTVIDVMPERLSEPTPVKKIVTPECLSELARHKNIEQLHQLGGVPGVASYLKSDAESGIQGDDEEIARRRHNFGSNTIQKPTPKTLPIVLETVRDPIIIILLVCATLSVCFGITRHGRRGWSDGGSIFVAVILVIMVTATSNLWPRRQFFKLWKARDKFSVSVIRNGQQMRISVFEAVVGDIICLKTGDQVPADGLFIDGNPLQVNESCIAAWRESVEINESCNPFFLSGTKVINGSARMLVTAVGINTEWGKMLSSKSYDIEERTPLQRKLRELTIQISKVGLMVASLVLVVLLVRYFVGNMRNEDGKSDFTAGKTNIHEVCNDLIGILATPVAIAATAIPEGLLLAVMITIAYSTNRMASQKALVRNLSACEAVGSADVICTDERGSLTLNHLIVSQFCFDNKLLNAGTSSIIPRNVLGLLREGMLLRSTEASSGSPIELFESQVHSTIQAWSVQDMGVNVEQVRANCAVHSPESFNSENTQSSIWIKRNTSDTIHVHQKGQPKIILATCSQYYDEDGIVQPMSIDAKRNLEQIFQKMKSNGLSCVAFAHKEVSEEHSDENSAFIGCLGLKCPCRPEVQKAVMDCREAEVDIKLVTRNDLPTARAIAIECGIIDPTQDETTGELVDRQSLQSNAETEIKEKCGTIRVMARASTLDKLHMVQGLKERGHVVAVTGHSIGDATVLREADAGLSLGIQGTSQAKENSDIIILDDNFVSVARVLRWGRGMYHKIQMYAQFQLSVSIACLVIDFVTAVSAKEPPTINIVAAISSGKVPYAAFQVLWVKLIVGALAALAITIEEPPEELRQLPPVNQKRPFITSIMWKNIVGQAVYPIIVLLTIQFKGQSTFNLDAKIKDTMIFNILVLWEIFVIFNTKRVEGNFFKGIHKRKMFWGVILAIILLQVLIGNC